MPASPPATRGERRVPRGRAYASSRTASCASRGSDAKSAPLWSTRRSSSRQSLRGRSVRAGRERRRDSDAASTEYPRDSRGGAATLHQTLRGAPKAHSVGPASNDIPTRRTRSGRRDSDEAYSVRPRIPPRGVQDHARPKEKGRSRPGRRWRNSGAADVSRATRSSHSGASGAVSSGVGGGRGAGAGASSTAASGGGVKNAARPSSDLRCPRAAGVRYSFRSAPSFASCSFWSSAYAVGRVAASGGPDRGSFRPPVNSSRSVCVNGAGAGARSGKSSSRSKSAIDPSSTCATLRPSRRRSRGRRERPRSS